MTERDAIIQLHCASVAAPSIIKQLNVAKSTIYHTISRYKELGNSNDRPRTGRPRTPSLEKLRNISKMLVLHSSKMVRFLTPQIKHNNGAKRISQIFGPRIFGLHHRQILILWTFNMVNFGKKSFCYASFNIRIVEENFGKRMGENTTKNNPCNSRKI